MLIDSHMHLFPDKLAAPTLDKLREVFGGNPYNDATLAGTLAAMDAANVTMGVVFHIATSVRSQQNVNQFALQVQQETGGRLLSFGSVHPDAPDAVEQLHSIVRAGLHGVKLHPDYQGFYLHDTHYYPLYEEISGQGLPLALHTGFDPLSPNDIHATTAAVVQLAKTFPRLTIIAAHMGGMGYQGEEVPEIFGMKNVYFDTAVAPVCYRGKEALFGEHLHRHGVERVLFGTDSPWETVPHTLDLLESVLTPVEMDRVCYQNARELFSI